MNTIQDQINDLLKQQQMCEHDWVTENTMQDSLILTAVGKDTTIEIEGLHGFSSYYIWHRVCTHCGLKQSTTKARILTVEPVF